MANVTFQVPEVLSRYSDGEASVPLQGWTVAEVVEALFARHPDLRFRVYDRGGRVYPYLILFRNGDELPRENLDGIPVTDGDVIELVGAAEGGSGDDVRMRGFRKRMSVDAAREIALADTTTDATALASEDVALEASAGRVLASEVVSQVNVPAFRRAAMDGYAVHAEDTFGATEYAPISLHLTGESMPGGAGAASVPRGSACRIMTGAPVPDGADAVLKAERAREEGELVLATGEVTPGKNVGRVGEDVTRGDALLGAGRRLRPQDVGLLASVGCAPVGVVRRPRVRLLMTGNELLAPGERPDGHRIVDSNTPMLRALLERDGAEIVESLRLPDDRATIRESLARDDVDVLITAGGTSVGREDYLPLLVRELGELPVHGVAMRPAAPTGIGRIGGMRVFLLPGNPVSCLSAYDVFAGPVVRRLAGLPMEWPYAAVELPLAQRVASQLGRTDYVRVAIREGGVVPLAISGASVLSSTTRADGFALIPAGSEGLADGATVTVHLYDGWTFGAAAPA